MTGTSKHRLAGKAAKLDFSALPSLDGGGSTVLPPSSEGHRPKTAPGAMMAFAADARSDLLRENDALKERAEQVDRLQVQVNELASELTQWEGAKATRQIDPARIRRSRWANRHEASYADPDFAHLKEELASAGGNVQPIKVRIVGQDERGDLYEVVYGHRRHQGCLELGLPVLALVENVSDQGLFVEMERENRARKNLSAWEQGTMYRRALDEGLFPSQRKLAEAVGADLTNVGKALRLARLPEEVVQAFASPMDLQFRYAQLLDEAFQKDAEGLRRRAGAIAKLQPRLGAKETFDRLVAAEPTSRAADSGSIPLRVKESGVGTIHVGRNGRIDVVLDAGAVNPKRVRELAKVLERFLSAS